MPNIVTPKTKIIRDDISKGKQLLQAFSLISDPIFVLDHNLNIRFYNEALLRLINSWELPPPRKHQHITEIFPFMTEDWITDYKEIFQSKKKIIERVTTIPEDPTEYNIHTLPTFNVENPKFATTIIKFQSNDAKTAKQIKYIEKKYEGMMKALRESEDRFRKLITQMGEGVWLFDTSQKTIFVNDALCQMLKYSERELIGSQITDFIISASQGEFNSVIHYLDNESASNPIEITFLNKFGAEIYTKLILSSITSPDNQKIGNFCVISDITKEKTLQDLQDRFIATTAHELRTPLTVLNGYIDLLQIVPNVAQTDLLTIIDKMSRNVNRLLRLVKNVHDLSAVQANLFSIDRKEVNLFEFSNELKDQITILFPKRNIFWDTNIASDSNLSFNLDNERIKQAVENLVSNSVKNSHKDSPINVRLLNKPDELSIVVQDQGTGISNEDMLQLFRPFAHKPTRYSQSGTGLGLYIIKAIIQAHGGTIEVVSGEADTGCIFTIRIPKKEIIN